MRGLVTAVVVAVLVQLATCTLVYETDYGADSTCSNNNNGQNLDLPTWRWSDGSCNSVTYNNQTWSVQGSVMGLYISLSKYAAPGCSANLVAGPSLCKVSSCCQVSTSAQTPMYEKLQWNGPLGAAAFQAPSVMLLAFSALVAYLFMSS